MEYWRGCKDCGETVKFDFPRNAQDVGTARCKKCRKYRRIQDTVDLKVYAVADEQRPCGGDKCVGACSCPPCVDGGAE